MTSIGQASKIQNVLKSINSCALKKFHILDFWIKDVQPVKWKYSKIWKTSNPKHLDKGYTTYAWNPVKKASSFLGTSMGRQSWWSRPEILFQVGHMIIQTPCFLGDI
jgi:hypothetical protein